VGSIALLVAAPPAHAVGGGCTPAAHTFCVTNTSDTTDPGSLRAAMTSANTAGGTNTIGFNITGGGVQTITLASQLPAIATDLTIDGFSQPGSVQNTNAPDQGGLTTQLTIEIVGINGIGFYYECCAGSFHTLTFQGLALRGFDNVINGQGATTTPKAKINVYGCFIGTKVDGTALAGTGNAGTAVRVNYDNAQIGGTQPWQRNLLSGNAGAAILTAPFDATSSVVIEGNLIGTDAGATQAIPNGTATNWGGIYVAGAGRNVRIGCTAGGCASTASRNIISGNNAQGIFLAPETFGGIVRGLMQTKPDLVVICGDMVSGHTDEAIGILDGLKLLSRAPLGAWFCFGNHDYYGGNPDELRDNLAGVGVQTLRNESISVNHHGKQFVLGGIDDRIMGKPNFNELVSRHGRPDLLLAHNPDHFYEAEARGIPLTLSGHTHGGQIRMPNGPAIIRHSRYCLDEGVYGYRSSMLVVSRGLGSVVLPLRWGADPEAVLIEIESQ
jgi:hypothetical protein